MANHLDLEEQEQLDQLKHFWQQWGNLITWILIVVLGAFASWNAYQYWQRSQSTQASVLFDEMEKAVKAGGKDKIDRVLTDIKSNFGSTVYAQQASLLAAKQYDEMGKADDAKAALAWVAEHSSDAGYQAVARLRLAAILIQAKAYDEALKQLNSSFPSEFEALAADRKGDLLLLQGKKAEAVTEFQKAYDKMDEQVAYRRLVEVKLNALGVAPKDKNRADVPSAAASAP